MKPAKQTSSTFVPGGRAFLLGCLLPAALGIALGGCTLSAEAELPDVEVTQHDISFEGVPFGTALGELSTGKTFTQERPLDLPEALDSSVQAVKIELRAKTGIKNFDFLRALRITMSPDGTRARTVELVDYEKSPGTTAGATLDIASKNPVNILDQWKSETAVFTVEVAGTLPEQAWSVDMSVHFAGKLSYKY